MGLACSARCADPQTETHHRQALRPSPQLPSPTTGRSPSPPQPPPPRDRLPDRADPGHLSSPSQHIRDPALPPTRCVTPEEPPPLSGLQCPQLYNEDLNWMIQKALALLHPCLSPTVQDTVAFPTLTLNHHSCGTTEAQRGQETCRRSHTDSGKDGDGLASGLRSGAFPQGWAPSPPLPHTLHLRIGFYTPGRIPRPQPIFVGWL